MLVFIDDSGDTGFKFERGSSRYFVISLLIFDDDLEAEKMSVAIKQLKRDIGMGDHEEFKFNKSRNKNRELFLQTINQFSFRIRSLVVEKEVLYSPELHKKESFYAYFIKQVLKFSGSKILDAKVRIDGSGDRVFKKNFISYLRKELNSQDTVIMKQCRFVDSKSDVLIQAIDMIAGAIRRSYEDRENKFRDIIKGHIEDEWNFL